MTIQNPQISAPGNVSETQRLTAKSDRLSNAVDSWNVWYIGFGLAALMVAFLVFFAQWRIIRKGKELSQVQSDLIAAKDRELRSNLANKDVEIALANQGVAVAQERAAKAEERAGNAEKGAAEATERAAKAQASLALAEQHSAEANAKAEGFRLDIAKSNEAAAQAQAQVAGAMAEAAKANLELARIKLPRTLNLEQQKRIAAVLSKFSGTNVAFVVFGDPESLSLLGELDSTLQQAGWNRIAAPSTVSSDIGFNTARGFVFQANDVGLKISFPPDAPMMEPIVRSAAEAISAEGVPCEPHFSDRLKGTKMILVSVGQKRL